MSNYWLEKPKKDEQIKMPVYYYPINISWFHAADGKLIPCEYKTYNNVYYATASNTSGTSNQIQYFSYYVS